jgi:hypothetical protein
MFRLLSSLLAWLVFGSSVAIAAPCTQAVLRPDQSSITLQGTTTGSDTDFTCFQLNTVVGRRLNFRLIRSAGPVLAFNIDDVVENQDDSSFVTSRDSYKITVYELFRATSPRPFRISVTALPRASATDLENPAATVSAVVKLDYFRSPLFNFNEQPTPLMQKFFTSGFIAVWVAAMRHNKEGPVLDGDPLTGLQGVRSVTLKSTQTNLITSDHATVTALVVALPDGSTFTKPQEQNLRFQMERENSVWRINDIGSSAQPSLRGYLGRFK